MPFALQLYRTTREPPELNAKMLDSSFAESQHLTFKQEMDMMWIFLFGKK